MGREKRAGLPEQGLILPVVISLVNIVMPRQPSPGTLVTTYSKYSETSLPYKAKSDSIDPEISFSVSVTLRTTDYWR